MPTDVHLFPTSSRIAVAADLHGIAVLAARLETFAYQHGCGACLIAGDVGDQLYAYSWTLPVAAVYGDGDSRDRYRLAAAEGRATMTMLDDWTTYAVGMRPWILLAVGALLDPYGMPGPALVAPPPNGKAPGADVVLAHASPFHRRVEPSGREPYDTYQAEAHFAAVESGAAVVLSGHDHTAVVTRLADGRCEAHGLARLPIHGGWAVLHLDSDRPSVTRPGAP